MEHDRHGNECDGICMNCGAPMPWNGNAPWCEDCIEADDDAG